MRVTLLHLEPIRPLGPVEIVVGIDGETLRASLDWSTFERLAGDNLVNEDFVQDFVHQNRDDIELAIRAHLYAQGIPLSRLLSLTWDDLQLAQPATFSVTSAAAAPFAAGKA